MKKFTVVAAFMLVIALAVPVLAQDDGSSIALTYARYRFNHFIQDLGTGDTSEFFDDDFDTTFTFSKGEVELWVGMEWSDANMGGDKQSQASYNDALDNFGAKWTPESMADSEFFLQVGDLGTGFGRNVNNDDSPYGSIETGFKAGSASFVFGYGRNYEGNTDDDVEGDEHLLRGQVHMPVGESFTVGAYVAMYAFSDVILQEAGSETAVDGTVTAIPAVQGDGSLFLGSLEFSGSAGGADLYAETGFASGTKDVAVSNAAVEADYSGFYALGGAKFALSSVTLGVEAGFGSGDDLGTANENEGYLGVNNDFGIDEIIEDEILGDGLSNKMYAKVSVSLDPTEKMGLAGNFVYVAPMEDVVGADGVTMVDKYGFEVNGTMTYKLADNLNYILMGAFASLEEDWTGESSAFQMMNRLQFLF